LNQRRAQAKQKAEEEARKREKELRDKFQSNEKKRSATLQK
jgi:hypothetical protein